MMETALRLIQAVVVTAALLSGSDGRADQEKLAQPGAMPSLIGKTCSQAGQRLPERVVLRCTSSIDGRALGVHGAMGGANRGDEDYFIVSQSPRAGEPLLGLVTAVAERRIPKGATPSLIGQSCSRAAKSLPTPVELRCTSADGHVFRESLAGQVANEDYFIVSQTPRAGEPLTALVSAVAQRRIPKGATPSLIGQSCSRAAKSLSGPVELRCTSADGHVFRESLAGQLADEDYFIVSQTPRAGEPLTALVSAVAQQRKRRTP